MLVRIKAICLLMCLLTSFSVFSANEPLPLRNGFIQINKGEKYTNSPVVTLKVMGLEEKYQKGMMMYSNNANFSDAKWQPFEAELLRWDLGMPDGKKTVYAKFKDADNNETAVMSDDIILDTTPPGSPYVKINVAGGYLKDTSLLVDLTVSATDAKYVMISNTTSFHGLKWNLYKQDFNGWQLERGEDGQRTVYVKFMDVAQNETQVVVDKVVVDRQAPVDCSISIDAGAEFCVQQSKKVTLTIFSRFADSVIIAQDANFSQAAWEPYIATKPLILDGEDGEKTVYAKFKDKAGNTTGVFSDKIMLDTKPPHELIITINNNAEACTHIDKLVELQIKATDAELMMISNTSTFQGARWQNYQTTITGWKLDGEEDGERTVFVKFKDKAGNISTTVKDNIKLQRGFTQSGGKANK